MHYMVRKARSLVIALACLAVPALASSVDLAPYGDDVVQRQALQLARTALRAWVHGRAPSLPPDLHPALRHPSGVFVSLENRQRVVRGCRGTLAPTAPTLAEEIVANVRQACQLDPRHRPLQIAELDQVRIILCIPGQQDTTWPGEVWDAHRFGVLVEDGPRAAVMLPWEAPDSMHQVAWGRKRAGLGATEPCRMVRFEAIRFAESWPARPTHPAAQKPSPPPYW
jgi:AMMECR1 domain-containing protein